MSDDVETSIPELSFSRPIAEVEDRWLSSLDDDDVLALAERLSVAVSRPFESERESLAIQVLCGLFALGELGPGLLTVETLEPVLFGVLPRHAIVAPLEAEPILAHLVEALSFLRDEGLVTEANESVVRAYLAAEGMADRLKEALGNVELYDDEKRELVEEELEREQLKKASEKIIKENAKAKKKARLKVAKASRRKNR